MSFDESRLDQKYSFGAAGGPGFKTDIVPRSSGHEKRNISWSQVRGQWQISYVGKDQDDYDTLLAFFYAHYGRAKGFRFWDAQDFELKKAFIGFTDGATANFQIYKIYTVGSLTYARALYKIVADADVESLTLKVYVDGGLVTEGVGAGQFQIDRTTGMITLGATLAALGHKTIEVECEFDNPVRFDTDQWPGTVLDGQPGNRIYSVSLTLVEIRDYA